MAVRPREVNGTFQDLQREISRAVFADLSLLCK